MIRSIRHRGVKRLYEKGERNLLAAERADRIEDMVARLDVAVGPADLDLPGYGLHQFRGDLKGFWAMKVSANWRLVFRFKDGDVYDVNLVDYH